ncbi:MAG TPA: alpha/beta fold hydrolase [Bryobacteraceae bacterium]
MLPKYFESVLVKGWLHQPAGAPKAAMALFHGAGTGCESPLMVAVAEAFCAAGYFVLRGDLPFRQQGTPPRGKSPLDRNGIRRAAEELRRLAPGVRLCLAGHSYGGRQCSMLAAEDPLVAHALLLLSYPLHPPRKPEDLRTEHFPNLRTPVLFVHGMRDPLGSIAEMNAALERIPGFHAMIGVDRAGHGLNPSIAPSLPPALSAMMKLI